METPDTPNKLALWQISIINRALRTEYDEEMKRIGYDKVLSKIANEKGLKAAKEAEKEITSNPMTSIGQIAATMQTVESISVDINNAFKNVKSSDNFTAARSIPA